MAIKEYTVYPGDEDYKCKKCKTREDIVFDEDGDPICIDCLFERESLADTDNY